MGRALRNGARIGTSFPAAGSLRTVAVFKTIVRVLFGAFFIIAGITHFTNRDFFTAIVPPYLPWPVMLVYVSGVAEIALGILLMIPRTTRLAAWGLIALLIAVFPANIHMYVNSHLYPDTPRSALLIRLPLQGVLAALAYWFARPGPRAKLGR